MSNEVISIVKWSNLIWKLNLSEGNWSLSEGYWIYQWSNLICQMKSIRGKLSINEKWISYVKWSNQRNTVYQMKVNLSVCQMSILKFKIHLMQFFSFFKISNSSNFIRNMEVFNLNRVTYFANVALKYSCCGFYDDF